MLHIHNGDSSADTAKQSSLPGEQFAWREALVEGPTPAGLGEADWRSVRAHHLSEVYDLDIQECEQGLLEQEQRLATFSEHDEVVLWFEHDLYCQLHLIYLLDWFSQKELGKTKLSLICIGKFPGKENFRGLGELNAEQLASLFPERTPVTSAQLNLGASAWQAYSSSNPTDLESFLHTDTSALPFLGSALQAHLSRFPSTKNGLGRIENTGLQFLRDGPGAFSDLFPRFGAAEPVYGLGDAQFWLELRRMSDADKPLLTIGGLNGDQGRKALTPEIVHQARLEITERGKSVLNGEADFVELNGINQWLGGVHLSGKDNVWRWDETTKAILHE